MTFEVQADKFDLIIIQNDLRRFYHNMEDGEFKLIIKEKNNILKQYKKQQQELKKLIDDYINKSLIDEKYIISQKRALLIDSAFEIIKEASACYDFTQEIFGSLPDKRISTLMDKRTNIFNQYYYIIYNTLFTNNECLICRDLINKIDFYKCKTCVAMFHSSCTDKWLNINLNCPMCREPLLIKLN